MKKLSVLVFAAVIVGCFVPASAQYANRAQVHNRDSRKAEKQALKAQKKYAKAQKKAEKKMLKTERKGTHYPPQRPI